MRQVIPFVLGLCMAAGALANQTDTTSSGAEEPKVGSPEPRAVLEKAQAAFQGVKQARYSAQYQGDGWVAEYVAKVEGTAMLGEASQHDIARFRCEVELTPPKSKETISLTAGSDGDLFFLMDPQTKTVYADIDDAVLGTHGRNVRRLLLREFVVKEPLAEELEGKPIERREDVDVGGEMCYQVYVAISESRGTIWFISHKDWLPRRVDRLYKDPKQGEGSTRLVLTDLVVSTTCEVEQFKLTIPSGFTRSDDFAP
jgi:hypothetical protein